MVPRLRARGAPHRPDRAVAQTPARREAVLRVSCRPPGHASTLAARRNRLTRFIGASILTVSCGLRFAAACQSPRLSMMDAYLQAGLDALGDATRMAIFQK